MNRFLLVTAVMASLGLAACADSDSETQAIAEETTTTTVDDTSLEAWCLGWNSPVPDVELTSISAEDLQTLYEAIQARDEAMLEVAPAEIAEANKAVVDFGRELNAYLAEFDWNPSTPPLDGSREIEPVQEEMAQFAEDNC